MPEAQALELDTCGDPVGEQLPQSYHRLTLKMVRGACPRDRRKQQLLWYCIIVFVFCFSFYMEDGDVRHKMVGRWDAILYTLATVLVIFCYSVTTTHPDRGKQTNKLPSKTQMGWRVWWLVLMIKLIQSSITWGSISIRCCLAQVVLWASGGTCFVY